MVSVIQTRMGEYRLYGHRQCYLLTFSRMEGPSEALVYRGTETSVKVEVCG